MMVLIDSSVWIEYFQKKSLIDAASVDLLIEERRVATCLPIKAEILSGEMSPPTNSIVNAAFDSMTFIDPDWNSHETWGKVANFSSMARKGKQRVSGMIDRMILLAAQESGALLWTLDRKLRKSADLAGVHLYSEKIIP